MSETLDGPSGVQTILVTEDEGELRLDRWFHRHFPTLNHGRLEKLLRTGQVRVDGKRAAANLRLESGQTIRVPPLPAAGESQPTARPQAALVATPAEAKTLRAAILYQDQDVIILNKPAGWAVQGGTGQARPLDQLLGALADGGETPRLAHRLDRDTSGVLVLGRTANATAKLAAAFKARTTRKCYWALVVGVPSPRKGRIDAAMAKRPGRAGEKMQVDEEGDKALTWYRVVDAARGSAAWLELEPRTGRTHQLRVHCALLGTPIQGDGKYGGQDAYLSAPEIGHGLHLHARAIRIPHPKKGIIEVTAPLPSAIAASFAYFGFSEADAGPPFASFEGE